MIAIIFLCATNVHKIKAITNSKLNSKNDDYSGETKTK